MLDQEAPPPHKVQFARSPIIAPQEGHLLKQIFLMHVRALATFAAVTSHHQCETMHKQHEKMIFKLPWRYGGSSITAISEQPSHSVQSATKTR